MPGIFGIISPKPPDQLAPLMGTMLETMNYEDFYSTGQYRSADLSASIGWVCHQNSFSDCLPIKNEKKDITLLFFGENNFDKSDISQLKSKNHVFNQWNASYIVHLYEEEGVNSFSKLNGIFCGALIDNRQKKIFLFNDRYGFEKIFYYRDRDGFFFSSEAKALLSILPQTRHIHLGSLAEHIFQNSITEYKSLFKNILIAPEASLIEFQPDRGPVFKKYFDFKEFANQPYIEDSSFHYKINNVFHNILPKYLRSKHKIGIPITDNRYTRALIPNLTLSSDRTFGYAFSGLQKSSFDADFCKTISNLLNIDHHIYRVDSSFYDQIPDWFDKTIYTSDGYCDLESAYYLSLNKQIRNHANVKVTGNHADLFFPVLGIEKNPSKDLLISNHKMRKIFDQHFLDHSVLNTHKDKFNPKHMEDTKYGHYVCERSQIPERAPFIDNDLIRVLYQAKPGISSQRIILETLFSNIEKPLKNDKDNIIENSFMNIFSKNTDTLCKRIHKEIEYQYIYKLPSLISKIDYSLRKTKIKSILSERFYLLNYRIIFRDNLSSYLRDTILCPNSYIRSFTKTKKVKKIIDYHLRGDSNYIGPIKQLLAIELLNKHINNFKLT